MKTRRTFIKTTGMILVPVWRVAGKYGVPCLIDLWGDLEVATRMVTTFPSTPFIMAHMGGYLCKDKLILDSFISLAEIFPNVFLDLGGVILPEMIVEAVKRIGSKRMMWGSDGPHPEPEMDTNAQSIPDLATFTRTELNRITHLKLIEKDKINVLGKSIIQLSEI